MGTFLFVIYLACCILLLFLALRNTTFRNKCTQTKIMGKIEVRNFTAQREHLSAHIKTEVVEFH